MNDSTRKLLLDVAGNVRTFIAQEFERGRGRPNVHAVADYVFDQMVSIVDKVEIDARLPDRDERHDRLREAQMTTQQRQLSIEVAGIVDQIEKGHYLNVHFRAFQLAMDAWQEHVRQNAIDGSRAVNSPGGAVLDEERDGSFKR